MSSSRSEIACYCIFPVVSLSDSYTEISKQQILRVISYIVHLCSLVLFGVTLLWFVLLTWHTLKTIGKKTSLLGNYSPSHCSVDKSIGLFLDFC